MSINSDKSHTIIPIRDYTFAGWRNLREVESSVEIADIGIQIFHSGSSLTRITVNSNNPVYRSDHV